jgi:membrane protein insertase, yidC/oxa1 family
MDLMVLTKINTPVIGWVSDILGMIMDIIFRATAALGITNIGLCIIIFTILINLLLLPLTIQQQRSSKLMSVMQPEIQAIQKKYKGKTDNETALKMQRETQAVYDKYGTSMVGGCVQMIIQMPILLALYQVISKIPAYVPSVKTYFEQIAAPLMKQSNYIEALSSYALKYKLPVDKIDYTDINRVIDLLYKFNPADWTAIKNAFASVYDLSAQLANNVPVIEKMNEFLGINLATNPFQGWVPNLAWIIPVLAGATQWFSAKLMSTGASQAASDENSMAQQMKTMTNVMPLMSVYFCFILPAGVGIYWIISALSRIVQQYFINKHLDKIDIQVLVEENLKKRNEKRAKKGLPPETINKKAISKSLNSLSKEKDEKQEKKNREVIADSTEYYKKNAKPGSIASKANMVAAYNEKMNEKKTGRKKSSGKEENGKNGE